MAVNKILFKLPNEVRASLDKRINARNYPTIADLHRWLLNQGGEPVSENTLRRYIASRENQAEEAHKAALDLLKRPMPEDMHEVGIFSEIGALTRLGYAIGRRLDALNRELDARHAATAGQTP